MTWQIDPVHSSLTFSVKHMMVSTVRGHFSGIRGTIDFDPESPQTARVEATVPAATIDTGSPDRDNHLRSADFFEAERYPEINFRSRKVERNGDSRYTVVGDLTVRGVTKPVVLDAEFFGIQKDPRMGTRAGLAATTTIDRKDFGLTWNVALESGGILVGDKVKIDLDVAAVQQAEQAAA